MADDTTTTFHWVDYLVLGLFFGFSLVLGIIVSFIDRKKASSQDFLMGGGNMHWVPMAFSMQASFLSAITLLSIPTEIYNFGMMYAYFGLSYIIALPMSGHMIMPTFYKLKLISAYEYLEIRFSRAVRLAGSITFCIMMLLYMSIVLYAPAIALAQVTGLSVALSITLCGLVSTIYTALGGMKATVWNDFFQMLIVIIGLAVVVIIGSIRTGGLTSAWQTNIDGGRVIFDNFNPDPTIRTTFWTQLIGGTFIGLAMYASSQTVIQKYNSVGTLTDAKKSIWLAVLTSLVIFILDVLIGILMYDFYADCDPLLSGKVSKPDQMAPLYVIEVMGDLHGLPGLYIATSFSAALSSVSGSLNGLAAVCLLDFIAPVYRKYKGEPLSERTSSYVSRGLTLAFGFLTIGLGFLAQVMGELILQMAYSIWGFVGGPLTCLVASGIFFPFVNSWGALAGLITSFTISSWIAVGTMILKPPTPYLNMSTAGCFSDNSTDLDMTTPFYSNWSTPLAGEGDGSDDSQTYLWVYRISHMYYGLISFLISFPVAIVVSLITGRAKDTDPRLTFEWANECCCYCPRPCKECLRCGAKVIEEGEEEEQNETIDSMTICNHEKLEGSNGVAKAAVTFSSSSSNSLRSRKVAATANNHVHHSEADPEKAFNDHTTAIPDTEIGINHTGANPDAADVGINHTGANPDTEIGINHTGANPDSADAGIRPNHRPTMANPDKTYTNATFEMDDDISTKF